jgi:hypothetical protein
MEGRHNPAFLLPFEAFKDPGIPDLEKNWNKPESRHWSQPPHPYLDHQQEELEKDAPRPPAVVGAVASVLSGDSSRKRPPPESLGELWMEMEDWSDKALDDLR